MYARSGPPPIDQRLPSYWATRHLSESGRAAISLADRTRALQLWGNFSLAYSVAYQPKLEYFGDANGFLAYGRRGGYTFVLGDPLCPEEDKADLLRRFLAKFRSPSFVQINESTARCLVAQGFKINEIGIDTWLELPSYSFAGKDKEWLRYADNWVTKRGYRIEEGTIADREAEVLEVSERWRSTRTISRKEVRFLNRPIPMTDEPDVRRFFYVSPAGRLEAFVFFDPLYEGGRLAGYVTCIKRRIPESSTYAEAAIMKRAIETFKRENVSRLWLGLSPLADIEDRLFQPSRGLHWVGRYLHHAAWFNRLCYNFHGHTQYKKRFRGNEVKMYYASRSPNNTLRILTFCSLCGAF